MNKNILKIVGIVIAALFVIAIALPFFINVNNYRPQIESNLSSALGRPVKVGDLSLSILSGSVEANQLSIADDPKFSNTSFIQAKSLKVGVELMPLIFSRQLNVTHLAIEKPQIALLRNREGIWNFSSLGNQANRQDIRKKQRPGCGRKPERWKAGNKRWNNLPRLGSGQPQSGRG